MSGNGAEDAPPAWPVSGVLLAGLWLFVRGVDLTPTAVVGEFLIGLGVGLPIAYGGRRLYRPGTDVRRALRAVPYATLYLAVFLKDLVVANVDVAYRVLAPSMPIEPVVIKLPLRVRTEAGITAIANSITLTPGTLTMDYDEDRNTLYIHAIAGADREAVVEPIRRWEEYALVIFDEELKPGDPIPDPDRDGGRPAADGGGGSDGS